MKKSVKAYAKVNLGLKVVKKCKNNYHKLKMVMATIDLYDEITFEECDDIVVETNKYICDYHENLCYKVAAYLQQRYKVKQGIKIYISKNIPDGGGLGGGSSDAAEVLKFLNEYWNLKLKKREMKEIAFSFGCDIPFFIDGNYAYVSGYGEKIKRIKQKLDSKDILVVVPEFSLSTSEVFSAFDKRNNNIKGNIKNVVKNINDQKYYFNELESAANEICDEKIKKIIEKLEMRNVGECVMSGSGSSIICYIDSNEYTADELKKVVADCKIISSKLKVYSY